MGDLMSWPECIMHVMEVISMAAIIISLVIGVSSILIAVVKE